MLTATLRNVIRLASVFTIALFLAACSGHFSAGDLLGKYVLSVDDGVDTIELDANETYVHSYKPKGGAVDYQNGTWALEELQAGPTVVLNGFRSLRGEPVSGQVIYLLLVRKSLLGAPRLITNIDLNEGYVKQ